MVTGATYRHPPVVETVLGVQFDRVRGLTNGHLGAFWERNRNEWPNVSDAPLLDEQFEAFGKQMAWSRAFQLKVTRSPAARLWMKNAAGDRMVQVQNCRLDYNWIGKPGQEYPRYRTVRPGFDGMLREFVDFVGELKLGGLVANQWEVTYVNHMPRGTVWNAPGDWQGVFKSMPGPGVVPSGTSLESFGAHWHFEIPPQRGRLHVELQHAYLEGQEKTEALVVKLTARGPIGREGDAMRAIDDGLNLGHDVVVRSFDELTSEQAHGYWNRET